MAGATNVAVCFKRQFWLDLGIRHPQATLSNNARDSGRGWKFLFTSADRNQFDSGTWGMNGPLEASTDEKFTVVFEAIRQLMAPPEPKKKRGIGFLAPMEK